MILGQDAQFSQYYANPLYLNPALAGTSGAPRVTLNYRNQFPGLPAKFVTYNTSFDRPIEQWHGGVGFNIMKDVQGDGTFSVLNVDAAYTYFIRITHKFYINASMQASYYQRKLDWEKVIMSDMIDDFSGTLNTSAEIQPRLNKNFLDFSTGLLAYGKNYYGGISFKHINHRSGVNEQRNTDFLPVKTTIHGGVKIPLLRNGLKEEKFSVSPNVITEFQGNFKRINYGMILARKFVSVGFWVRQDLKMNIDSYVIMLGFVFSKFHIGYSYDISGSEIGRKQLNAHEVTLSMDFNMSKSQKKMKPIECPKF